MGGWVGSMVAPGTISRPTGSFTSGSPSLVPGSSHFGALLKKALTISLDPPVAYQQVGHLQAHLPKLWEAPQGSERCFGPHLSKL